MRHNLSRRPWKFKSSIVNLDNSSGAGTHLICFRNTEILWTILTVTGI